jgi:hypothetical protein
MGLGLLIARPGAIEPDLTSATLRAAGAGDVRSLEIGSHAARADAATLRPHGA